MRSFLCQLLVLCLFWMGIDGALDIANLGHGHADTASAADRGQTEQAVGSVDTAQGDGAATNCAGDHCERCCHGHLSALATQVTLPLSPPNLPDHGQWPGVPVLDFSHAPPTPPPNA